MTPREAASELGKLGALKRRQNERERILERARQMCRADGIEPPAGLFPPLILTTGDRA
jgi:hypothetical protein